MKQTGDRVLNVAVVGLGVGKQHVQAYRELPDQFKIVAICDLDTDLAQAVADANHVPDVVSNFDNLCRRDDIDVVDICTPPHLHVPMALQALDAGKHVICEKPVAGSLADLDKLVEADARAKGRLMPNFNYRFGHGIQKLRHLQAEGLAGHAYLSTVETAWKRGPDYYATPWRGKWATELGGALVTHAIHAHDSLYYVVGPARHVFARVATLINPIEVEDCASVSLKMADGSLASLSVTLGSPDQITRQRYCFSNLTAESNREPYGDNTSEPWKFTAASPEIGEQIQESLSRFQPLPEGFAGEFYRFHQAVTEGGDLPVTLQDARNSLELITAIYHSARTGEPVDLPLPDDHPLYEGWLPKQAGRSTHIST